MNFIGERQSPTAALIGWMKAFRKEDRSEFHRQITSRIFGIAAAAFAALEGVAHTLLFVGKIPLFLVNKVVWYGMLGGVIANSIAFALMNGDAGDFRLFVIVKRVFLHIILLGREPSVVFNHLKLWSGLACHHALLIKKQLIAAFEVEKTLSRLANFESLTYEACKSVCLMRFVLAGCVLSLLEPDEVVNEAVHLDLVNTEEEPAVGLWRRIKSLGSSPLAAVDRICKYAEKQLISWSWSLGTATVKGLFYVISPSLTFLGRHMRIFSWITAVGVVAYCSYNDYQTSGKVGLQYASALPGRLAFKGWEASLALGNMALDFIFPGRALKRIQEAIEEQNKLLREILAKKA